MNELISLYRSMLRIRLAEETIAARYAEQQMRCPTHLCVGQEAVASGVCHHLRRDDVIFSNHRAHGHYLAKGGDMGRMIAEIYGRAGGCCGGRGGSMHLIDVAAGVLGATPIVGGTIPLAVGAAFAFRAKGEDKVSAVFFGDGCFEEGVMHESMNFAALRKLPVIFVCENNGYSVYTNLKERQPDRPIHKVAEAHGLRVHTGDGNDVVAVAEIAKTAIHNARNGDGPQFMEFLTHRWREHCGPNYDDDLGYRCEGELEYWQDNCPALKLKDRLMREGASATEFDNIEKEVQREVDAAFEFALASPAPYPDTISHHVYSV